MRARILVCAGNDGEDYTVLHAIADERTMDLNDEYLPREVQDAKGMYGDTLQAYGFVDIEIPDAVIAKVVRRQVSAGVVEAVPVDEEYGDPFTPADLGIDSDPSKWCGVRGPRVGEDGMVCVLDPGHEGRHHAHPSHGQNVTWSQS